VSAPDTRRSEPDRKRNSYLHPPTGRPYANQKLRRVWVDACEAAGVEYVPLYHATKHTAFTALRDAGASRDEVQALARHRDPRTTDVYDLDDDQRRKRALSALEELEERGRQTGVKGNRVAKLPKSAKSRRSPPGKDVGRQGLEPWTLGLKERTGGSGFLFDVGMLRTCRLREMRPDGARSNESPTESPQSTAASAGGCEVCHSAVPRLDRATTLPLQTPGSFNRLPVDGIPSYRTHQKRVLISLHVSRAQSEGVVRRNGTGPPGTRL
jgi:hypothetical protein